MQFIDHAFALDVLESEKASLRQLRVDEGQAIAFHDLFRRAEARAFSTPFDRVPPE